MSLNFDWRNALYLITVTVPVFVLDQITKVWAKSLQGKEAVEVFSSWFHLTYAENRGALFGLGNQFSEMMRKLVFLGFSTAVTLVILFAMMIKSESKLMTVIYALVLGGAAGNLFDRFAYGYVIDFIDWHIGDIYHWPTFNIADVAIVVAVALIALELLIFQKKGASR